MQCHAANLLQLANGDMACVWFGGTQEGMADISIWFSRLPAGGNHWTGAVQLSNDPGRSEQNPILFETPDGRLHLIWTAQRAGNQDTAVVRSRTSADGGASWGPIFTLVDVPGTFVRQPPVIDGEHWILPTFLCRVKPGQRWSGDNDISAVLHSTDAGRSWVRHDVPDSVGAVHMSIVPAAGSRMLAFYRSRWADFIYRSVSDDGGNSWSAPQPTTLPNNNASIQALRLADGRLAVVYNHASAADATERRLSLYDEIEDDTAPSDETAPPPARTAFWPSPRAGCRGAVHGRWAKLRAPSRNRGRKRLLYDQQLTRAAEPGAFVSVHPPGGGRVGASCVHLLPACH